ncbi:chymotrypsin-elastase inhibitor ixodidin [Drosophila eugracilis]|uniref:chymotrypsin-elastase inhibitor ixodidin n=1 Tax=Drosophila eugracilis TaxID=29029 RepID=UPI0007E6CAF6|nr:chymotrypsin-elastase inhibitor ixodidin [Drosophila eugracilis]
MARCQLYIVVFLMAISLLNSQAVEGSLPRILGFFLRCTNDEMGSLCTACERTCGQKESVNCVLSCNVGCICQTGWIRKNNVCVPVAQCDEKDLN